MSIGRSLFNEMRPFFRLLEDPFGRSTFPYGSGFPVPSRFAHDPLYTLMQRPAVDVKEQGDQYIVDADLPGISKENLEIRLDENGESLTIQGKMWESSEPKASTAEATSATSTSKAIEPKEGSSTQISTERPASFSRNMSFSRTIWLPQPVEREDVSAKLENGVLTVRLQKAKQVKQSDTVIPID